MHLTHTGVRFEVVCTRDELPKVVDKGLTLDGRVGRYTTNVPELALQFKDFADAPALEIFRQHRQVLLRSEATDVEGVTFPAPADEAYLGYQKVGILYGEQRKDTLIADEMGLGKTIQAAGLMNKAGIFKRVLIIPRQSLLRKWRRELVKWLIKPASIEIATSTNLPKTDIILANYDIIWKLRTQLEQRGKFDLLTCDESHYLQNPFAQRTMAVLGEENNRHRQSTPGIAAERRLFLTGTPILKKPISLWPLVRTIDPQGLGASYDLYTRRYCAAWNAPWGYDVSGSSHRDELQSRLRSTFMIRRLKKDVLKDLPPKRRRIIPIAPKGVTRLIQQELALTSKINQRGYVVTISDDAFYKQQAAKLRREDTGDAGYLFEELSVLRHELARAKVPYAVEHIKDALEQVPCMICFCHHTDVLLGVWEQFKDIAVVHYGGLTGDEKDANTERFQNDESCRLLVASITAAEGYDAFRAPYELFIEFDTRPPVMDQAEDRAHRIGQVNPLLIDHLVFDESLDVKRIQDLIKVQEELSETFNVQQ